MQKSLIQQNKFIEFSLNIQVYSFFECKVNEVSTYFLAYHQVLAIQSPDLDGISLSKTKTNEISDSTIKQYVGIRLWLYHRIFRWKSEGTFGEGQRTQVNGHTWS